GLPVPESEDGNGPRADPPPPAVADLKRGITCALVSEPLRVGSLCASASVPFPSGFSPYGGIDPAPAVAEADAAGAEVSSAEVSSRASPSSPAQPVCSLRKTKAVSRSHLRTAITRSSAV